MSSRPPRGRRPVVAGSLLALLAAAATTVAIAVPSGAAAASETEYTSNFNSPCILGTGSLNIETSLALAVRADGPASVPATGALTFNEGSITLTAPEEVTEAFVSLGAKEVKGVLKQLPAIVTQATPASINLVESAGFGGIPFEGQVEAGHPLILHLAAGAPKLTWGPFTVTGITGQNVTLTASTAAGFEENETGYHATGAGIVATISAYTAEGTKLLGPLAIDCTAPANVVFAAVSITPHTMTTCTYTTHTPFPPGSIEPHEGPAGGGTAVSIRKGSPGNATSVEFGGVEVPFNYSSGGAISAISPPGTGTVYVHVTTECYGREFVGDFTYISSITAPGPEVTGIEPGSGPERGGTTVTLTGHNFTGTESVLFGKQPATSFKVNSASSITAVAPPGSGNVIVRAVGYGVSEEREVRFYYLPLVKPRVYSVEPAEGPPSGGTAVTITGEGFEEVKGVAFGSKGASSFTVNSPTSITAIAPSGSGSVPVNVTTAGGTNEAYFSRQFSYAPGVTSLEPEEGPGGGGTKVTIDGRNFYQINGVAFGSKAATSFTVNSPTSITAIAPSGSGSVSVTVTGAGGTGYGYFRYAPTVTAVTPAQGPVGGGTSVTISGSNFREVTNVAFGFQNATSYTVKSATTITAVAPAGSGRVPVTVTSAGGKSEVTAEDHFLYLLPGPRVSAWGGNENGQLGEGLTATSSAECNDRCSPLPVNVINLGEVASIATGSSSSASLALLKNGNVMAWGFGFLGNGETVLPEQCFLNPCSTYPVRVEGLSEVTAVATNEGLSLALLQSGKVMAWGSNVFGGLGNGKGGSYEVVNVPTPVSGLSEVSAVAVGHLHQLALLKNGTVMAWGDNSEGELGDGTTTERDTPVKVSGLSEVIAIAAGQGFSLALKRNGTVMAWGRNNLGQLGDGTSTGPDSCGLDSPCSTTPVPVAGLTGVRSISAGGGLALADLSNGTVMAWGGNGDGELGIGTNSGPESCPPDDCSTKPIAVPGLSEVSAVAAGSSGGLALKANGNVMAWGNDSSGEIGDGVVQYQFSPIESVHELGHAVSIAAGGFFNLAVVTETEPLSFKNWTLAGSITPKPLGQAIALPSGSTFNGSGELNTETGVGSVTGNISVPPFKAAAKLYGFVPLTLGMTVTQSGAITGTIAKSATVSGDETLTLPVQLKLGFTSLGLLGLNVPTSCSTTAPVSLTLTETLTKEALLSKGWAFSGTTTIPKITCTGGLLGALYGETINGLIAGAGSSYSLTVSAPGG